ncbi:formyltransferase family protein [Mucilaginibacter calamicampi]|uniref:Formyltransferase family protein n=1 Tax=Mucilaginibacter calamicampi TaxID=1302352 RepID=A0ABW2YT90_9SPHI
MRIVFIGTVIFSYKALEQIIADSANVVGVITRQTSVFNADYADLTPLCLEHNLPYKYVNDINHPNNEAFIRQLNPTVIYCFGWSNLIKAEILSIPPLGVVGFHPAALPYNRGRHPIVWALALGLNKTASTFFFMDSQADTGDIISQQEVPIFDEDTSQLLYDRIVSTALVQIKEFTLALQTGSITKVQQRIAEGNSWRKRNKSDGRIDFRMNSRTIFNLVRALTLPYVGAHIELANGEDVKVWAIIIDDHPNENIEPGKILNVSDNHIKVKTADGAVILTEHEFTQIPSVGTYL